MAVTFLNQLLFVQFQRETTQNKKLIRGLPPWGRDGLTGAPPSCSQQSKLFILFFLDSFVVFHFIFHTLNELHASLSNVAEHTENWLGSTDPARYADGNSTI